MLIVMGDMKGRVRVRAEEGAISRYGVPVENHNGKKTCGIYTSVGMNVANKYFQYNSP